MDITWHSTQREKESSDLITVDAEVSGYGKANGNQLLINYREDVFVSG